MSSFWTARPRRIHPVHQRPTTLDWYIKKIFKMEKTLAKVVGPVAKRIYNVPIPGDEYFDAIEHLFERLRGVISS